MGQLHSSNDSAIPPKAEGITRILLVRHCEAEGNTNGRFQGSSDCGISGNGEKQLELLALRLRNIRMDSIYSSPLKRARMTAEAINRYHHLTKTSVCRRSMAVIMRGFSGRTCPKLHRNRMPIGTRRRRIFARQTERVCARYMTVFGRRFARLYARILARPCV